jgi:hypothetical protein
MGAYKVQMHDHVAVRHAASVCCPCSFICDAKYCCVHCVTSPYCRAQNKKTVGYLLVLENLFMMGEMPQVFDLKGVVPLQSQPYVGVSHTFYLSLSR